MILLSLALLLAAQAEAPVTRPGACAYALVVADRTGRRADIHRSPTLAAGKVAKLGANTPVFICGAKGSFYWVHFAEGRHKCRGGTATGLDPRYASTCEKGWVQKSHIRLVSR